MVVVLDRLTRGLGRRGEERADVDVEAEIRKVAEAITLAAVVPILPHLGDEEARPAAVIVLERLHEPAHALHAVGHLPNLPLVDARNRADLGAVPAPHLLEGVRNLADGRLGARGLNGEFEKIAPHRIAQRERASSAASTSA